MRWSKIKAVQLLREPKYCWAPVMGTVTVLIPSATAGVWLSACQADGLEMSVLLYWTV